VYRTHDAVLHRQHAVVGVAVHDGAGDVVEGCAGEQRARFGDELLRGGLAEGAVLSLERDDGRYGQRASRAASVRSSRSLR
jgi:hypothetical protein